MSESLFKKVAGPLFKKRLRYRRFPVNFATIFRTTFLQNTSGVTWVKFINISAIRWKVLPCSWRSRLRPWSHIWSATIWSQKRDRNITPGGQIFARIIFREFRRFWLFLWNLISTKHHKTFHPWIWSSWNIAKMVIQEVNPRENQEKSSKNENEWQEVDIFHGFFFCR